MTDKTKCNCPRFDGDSGDFSNLRTETNPHCPEHGKPVFKYTTERPTVPGYYWFKTTGYEEIVRVRGEGAWIEFNSFGHSHAYRVNDPLVANEDIQWAGPIEIERPEE